MTTMDVQCIAQGAHCEIHMRLQRMYPLKTNTHLKILGEITERSMNTHIVAYYFTIEINQLRAPHEYVLAT